MNKIFEYGTTDTKLIKQLNKHKAQIIDIKGEHKIIWIKD